MTLFIEVLQMLELLMGFGKPSGGGGNVGPGPSELVAGTLEHGYYGEVPADEFINGNNLATQIGLTGGTAFNSDAGWLKFSLDYKTLFVAKKPFRYNLSWNQINARGAVFGTAQVTINGKLYKVRLLKGRGDGLTTTVDDGFDTKSTWGSEWNRLMYHLSGKPFYYKQNILTSEGLTEGDWAQFSEAELLTNGVYGSGSYNWCQDSSGASKVVRGAYGVSYVFQNSPGSIASSYGWRPCLELVG